MWGSVPTVYVFAACGVKTATCDVISTTVLESDVKTHENE